LLYQVRVAQSFMAAGPHSFWLDQHVTLAKEPEQRYTDDAAVAAHRATPHFEKYPSKINDLAERTAMMLDPLEVA
jgi:quinol monooxygenase YgiN